MGYKTVKRNSEFTITEKKSEFIGVCAPVKTEAEAIACVNAVKKKHSAARHNVYAYILRENNTTRFSDDGEPHGTAGMPVLDAMRKVGITDAVVVVTRYFGGILLGTGGLVRCYTAAAAGAVKEAEVAEMGDFSLVSLRCDYSDYQKIVPLVSANKGKIEESDFGSEVMLTVMIAETDEKRFADELTEATNGRVIAKKVGQKCDFIGNW